MEYQIFCLHLIHQTTLDLTNFDKIAAILDLFGPMLKFLEIRLANSNCLRNSLGLTLFDESNANKISDTPSKQTEKQIRNKHTKREKRD
jgi:hypothetical protein